MGQERRQYPRVEINQMVELSFGKERFLNVSGVNISVKGLLCLTEEEMVSYTRVYLLVTIPENGSFREIGCEGIVQRSEKSKKNYLTGVEFVLMKDTDKSALEKYVMKVEKGKRNLHERG